MKVVLGGVKGGDLARGVVMKTKAECDEIAGEKPQARPSPGTADQQEDACEDMHICRGPL